MERFHENSVLTVIVYYILYEDNSYIVCFPRLKSYRIVCSECGFALGYIIGRTIVSGWGTCSSTLVLR